MEILIMQRNYVLGGYKEIFHDNTKMHHLGKFFDQVDPSRALNWTKNPVSSSTEQIGFYIENNNVEIYTKEFYIKPEQYEYYDENKFIMNFHKFIKVLEKWKELTSKKPEFIIIKKINDDVFLEADFCEEKELKLENAVFSDEIINELFKLKTKDGLFCGNFNIKNTKENIKITHSLIDSDETISANITLEKDYTFNHAFFSDNLEIETIENVLKNELKTGTMSFFKNITQFFNKNETYFIAKVYILDAKTRIILNNNFELISFYPIFWRIK
ncbi:MAG: hypothetical protein ACD_82C00159G0002 [uncultured bacterium]|nr:MAG: hypothetical protein ACD_82C00159G0002 [uncultured bacterium]